MNDHEVYRPNFNLGDFRYEVAGYIRLLIVARIKREPDFFSCEDLERWQLPDPRYDGYSESSLLEKAAGALGRLNTQYLPRCSSFGVAITDDATPEGRLINAIAFLVPEGGRGGGPYHNGWLIDVSSRLRLGEQVAWWANVNWPLIQDIRNDLDMLPHPRRPGPWSRPRGPQEWCKVYSLSWDTLKKLFDEQKIQNVSLTKKLYKVHIDDLPKE